MNPRWPAVFALAVGLALLAWDAPPPDEPPAQPNAQPDAAQSPAEGAEAAKFQRFQLDPDFKSFEVTPPPPMTPPPDGPATPPPPRTLQPSQSITPPPP